MLDRVNQYSQLDLSSSVHCAILEVGFYALRVEAVDAIITPVNISNISISKSRL